MKKGKNKNNLIQTYGIKSQMTQNSERCFKTPPPCRFITLRYIELPCIQ